MPWWSAIFTFASQIYMYSHLFIYFYWIYIYIYLYADSHFVVFSITVMFPMMRILHDLFSAPTCHLTLQLFIFRNSSLKHLGTTHTTLSDDAPARGILDSRGNAVFARETGVTIRLDLSKHFAISRENFNATHPAAEISEING